MKLKKFIKNNYIYFLCFIIPMLLLIIPCALNSIFPIGNNYINIYDGRYQYPGLLLDYTNHLLKGSNLFYSFSGGLGYNMYGVFIYYLTSPLNLLSIFFTNENIDIFYTLIIFLKIGLCGLTCSLLLNYYKKSNWFLLAFSCCYALSSYNLMYFINIMWIDSVIMLPLIVLGIEKLINENKKALYLISLTLSIIFNFYIGFMCCIFSVIYFIYKYLLQEKKNKNKKQIKSFIILSILSGLICSIILIPEVFALLEGKATGFAEADQTNYFSFGLDFFNIFYKFTPAGLSNYDLSYGNPNVYVSLFVLCLVLIFFFNKSFSKKEKIVTGSIILFYFLCFSFNLLDYAWHMFQRPIWYPNRYSFTFDLFLIIIAYKSFINLDRFKVNNKFVISYIILVILIITSAFTNDILDAFAWKNIRITFLFFSILLLFDYIFVICFKNKYKFLLIVFLAIELSINSFYIFKTFGRTDSIEFQRTTIKSTNKKLTKIKEMEKNNTFYRMEFNNLTNYNNGGFYDYNGIYYFSSIRDSKTMNYLLNIGIKVTDGCSVKYSSVNPIINTLLGIKYFDGWKNEDYFENMKIKDHSVYYNQYTTPLIYTTSKNVYKTKMTNDSPLKNYKNIYYNITNDNDLVDDNFKIEKNNGFTTKGNYLIANNNTSYTYKLVLTKTVEKDSFLAFENDESFRYYSPILKINGKVVEDYYDRKSALLVKKGDKIKIEYEIKTLKIKKSSINAYLINVDALDKYNKIVNNNSVKITQFDNDNNIKFTINESENKVVSTTIPYSKSWNVYVDGKKIKTNQIYDAFLAFDISKGKHTIELKYIPKGFIIGSIITIISLLTSLLYFTKKIRNN